MWHLLLGMLVVTAVCFQAPNIGQGRPQHWPRSPSRAPHVEACSCFFWVYHGPSSNNSLGFLVSISQRASNCAEAWLCEFIECHPSERASCGTAAPGALFASKEGEEAEMPCLCDMQCQYAAAIEFWKCALAFSTEAKKIADTRFPFPWAQIITL